MARAGVQGVILAAGGFVVGLVVGGLGPRGEVRELEQQVFELERTKARGGGGTDAGAELARLITKGIEARDELSSTAPSDTDARRADRGTSVEGSAGDVPRPTLAEEQEDPIETAREVLDLRRTQARAALVEDADPSGEQLDELDRVVAAMNHELEAVARGFVREVGTAEPTRRQMMAAGADVLDVLAATEDRMLQALSPEQREGVREEATDPSSYVDPHVLDILAEALPTEGRR